MDLGSISTGLAQSAVANQVSVSVLKSLQNLEGELAGELFGSIGVGRSIDAYA